MYVRSCLFKNHPLYNHKNSIARQTNKVKRNNCCLMTPCLTHLLNSLCSCFYTYLYILRTVGMDNHPTSIRPLSSDVLLRANLSLLTSKHPPRGPASPRTNLLAMHRQCTKTSQLHSLFSTRPFSQISFRDRKSVV